MLRFIRQFFLFINFLQAAAAAEPTTLYDRYLAWTATTYETYACRHKLHLVRFNFKWQHSDLEKTIFSNPLLWWKATCARFPLLSRRAQKVLALMGTSAPSEGVFSSGGNVVTKNRASMHSDNVANLVFAVTAGC